jgi:uncharacterized protein
VAWYFIRRFDPRQDTRKVVRLIPSSLRPALAAGLALWAFAWLAAMPANAARVPGLYQAEVEYEGDRDEAFREALAQVLVRITGRRDIAGREEAQPLLRDAAAYAQQFRQPAPERLWAAFDGSALERALAELGLPVWGAERPSTLVWIAVDAGGGRRFVLASGSEFEYEEGGIRDELAQAATRRGLPVVFPLMDAEDRARASFAEVWGGFDDSILAASARYGVDAVLVGRLSLDDPGHGRWTLLGADHGQRWSGGVADSIDRLADLFAARFAVVAAGEARTLRLAVAGIESIDDYGRVSRFLGSLTAIEALSVETVEPERMVFRARLRGEPATLDEAVRLGGLLRPEPDPGPHELSYRVAR